MIAYSTGAYDILRENDLKDIDKQIQKSKEKGIENFAIGIYEDNLCQALGLNKPLKTIEDRMRIMEKIRGVDFVFSIPSLDEKIVREKIKEAFAEYSDNNKKTQSNQSQKKKYKLGYAPGTYDLFHAGHLENLTIASKDCEKLVVGVKADELVKRHKNKTPIISEEERMSILRHFKFVYDVYIYYTRDLEIANDYLKAKYNEPIEAIYLGSDLKNDFKDFNNLNIIYTDRDEQLMKERSTTAYSKKYKALSLKKSENVHLRGNAKPKDLSIKIVEEIEDKEER